MAGALFSQNNVEWRPQPKGQDHAQDEGKLLANDWKVTQGQDPSDARADRASRLSLLPRARRRFALRGNSMKIARLALLLPQFAVCALALPHPGPAKPALASPQTRAVNSSSAKPVLVYVSDFELDVLQGRAVKNASSRNSPRSISGSASSGRPTAQRSTSSGPSPNTSASARTTDSETDETPAGRANALVNPPSNDGRHGPVITVTSYAPVARFEMEREPADEDLKKIASQIAAALTALLNANPTAAP